MPSGVYKRSPEHRAQLAAQCRANGAKVRGTGWEMRKTTEYNSWRAMIARCFNPNNEDFSSYGGRGITVCERWRDFRCFFEDVGRRPSKLHSLDRIDNNGNYEPGNCRWATSKEQVNNRSLKRIENFTSEQLLGELARREQWVDVPLLVEGMAC